MSCAMYATRINPFLSSLLYAGLSLAASSLTGCGEFEGSYYAGAPDLGTPGAAPGGTYGVTPGGAQNIGYARDLIAQGVVPQPADIPIEGLLSEHDIAPLGPACDSLLCARPALAYAPDLATGEMAYWVHLGMTSGLPRDTFERPPIDVVVAIDKSSSMSIDMTETNEAVARLIDNLRDDDRLAVLAFDSDIHMIHELGPIADREALASQVRAIRAGGSWDLERGVGAAYDILQPDAGARDRMRRVMVFSCGYPAVAADGSDPFSQLVHAGADSGIGMSFFGVLLGYSEPLADLMARERGGAFYYLESLDRVVQVFDADFDTMITPVAYDMDFAFRTSADFEIAALFGVPGDHVGAPSYEIDVSTAFLSNRRGAMVARLERLVPDDAPIDEVGSVSLAYAPEPALGWSTAETQEEAIRVPGDTTEPPHFAGAGARKAVALVNLGQELRGACQAYHEGDAEAARARLALLTDYLADEAAAMNDAPLLAEVDLVEQLIANME